MRDNAAVSQLMVGLTLVAALTLFGTRGVLAEPLSYADLVDRLTNFERLAELPAAGEKLMQWSSYDRSSRYDEASGEYTGWSHNADGGGIIRTEEGKQVLGEMQGPGVIWRIWSAKPDQGHVRIYLDGKETPAIDLPFTHFFDGKHAPLTSRSCAIPRRRRGPTATCLFLIRVRARSWPIPAGALITTSPTPCYRPARKLSRSV